MAALLLAPLVGTVADEVAAGVGSVSVVLGATTAVDRVELARGALVMTLELLGATVVLTGAELVVMTEELDELDEEREAEVEVDDSVEI